MEHTGHGVGHVFVAEPQNQKSDCGERDVARRIVFDLMIVNSAIDFDHHTRGAAVKVRDETVDELLAAEVKPREAVPAQVRPEEFFFRGHLTTQPPNEFAFGVIDLLAGDEVRNGWFRVCGQTHAPEETPPRVPPSQRQGAGGWVRPTQGGGLGG